MRYLLGLLVILMTLGIHSFKAQDADAPENTAYLLQNNQLKQLDIISGRQELTFDLMPLNRVHSTQLDRTERRLWAADVDPTGQTLYQIEVWGRSQNRNILGAPTGGELVAINIATNTRDVIFDSTTVFNFVLSPDGQRMVVFFNIGEYLYSKQHACVLNLKSHECQPLEFDNIAIAEWINNQEFITRTGDANPLKLVNVDSYTHKTLVFPSEWQVYWGTLLPFTSYLVVSGQPYESALEHPNSFLFYNLLTDKVEISGFRALNKYFLIEDLLFSGDGKYLFYGSSPQATLIDFKSGELIQEFATVISAQWVDEQTLIVQGSLDNSPVSIMRFDAISRHVTILLQGEAASGMLLFP